MKNIISWFIFAPWASRFSLLVFTVSVWVQSVMGLSLWMLHSSLWGANVYGAKQSYSSPYFYAVLEIWFEYTVMYSLESGAFWKFSSSAHTYTCRILSPWTLSPSAVARSCTRLQHKATSSTHALIVSGKWECPALSSFFLTISDLLLLVFRVQALLQPCSLWFFPPSYQLLLDIFPFFPASLKTVPRLLFSTRWKNRTSQRPCALCCFWAHITPIPVLLH